MERFEPRKADISQFFNRSEGKSPKTVSWYNETLEDFIRYLEKEGLAPTLAVADELAVRRYILDLQSKEVRGRPISSDSVNCRMRALRAFYHWLHQQKYTRGHLLEHLRPPKAEEKIPELLTETEIARLFAGFNPFTALGARNIAILAVVLDGGLRLSELVELRDENAKFRRLCQGSGQGWQRTVSHLGEQCPASPTALSSPFSTRTCEPSGDPLLPQLKWVPFDAVRSPEHACPTR